MHDGNVNDFGIMQPISPSIKALSVLHFQEIAIPL